ncbi:hypothetical protein ABEG17_08410 [Pedococcus sp. KACC 23699]|uniref:Uncharacterized protein n=1 Tax=Pedococcus sp. KACC 23699 TaxID=3149228 RepID=A0AAU7JYJ2_9MICO
MSKNQSTTGSNLSGPAQLGAAAAVFIVCCIVQAACGSSMFSTSYADPGSVVKDLLLNVTFWPGWAITVGLALRGVLEMVADK